MRRLLLVIFFLAILALACGNVNIGTDLPTLVPQILPDSGPSGDNAAAASSPRDSASGGLSLPPTYTPAPSQLPPATVPPPGPTNTPRPDQIYIVQRGDTLAEIAARFDTTVEALARVNNIPDIDVIEVGQQLIIPDR